MTELDTFKRLKEMVLLKYQEHYPFFRGTWKSFSAQDIQNLIDLIERQCKQSISEKWVYTHLKPNTNTKIPRKDMLDILSKFVGLSGWGELVAAGITNFEKKKPSKVPYYWAGGIIVLALAFCMCTYYLLFGRATGSSKRTIEIKNEFTNKKVKSEDVKVFKIQDTTKQLLAVKDGKVQIENSPDKDYKVEIVSPFYKKKVLNIVATPDEDTVIAQVDLKPDDYAMMLKAFMLSDIKDWKTRKVQLAKILAKDLEVLIMLREDLGAEYFNKEEFSQKLIVPTSALKEMKIIEIKSNSVGEINFIRIKQ